MLDSLAQTRQSQQALLAGLPHDLKGPMARMALRIEMTEDHALKDGLARDLADMRHMTEQSWIFCGVRMPAGLSVHFSGWTCGCRSRLANAQGLVRTFR